MPNTPTPQNATNEVAKITSTIHFKNKYNDGKNIAVVVLNINYQQKSFSITPLSGSQDKFGFVKNNFAIIDNDIASTLEKWKAITKGIDQAGEYVENEFFGKNRLISIAAAGAALVAGCIMIERDKRNKKKQAKKSTNRKVLPKNDGKKPTVPQAVAIAKKVQKRKADEMLKKAKNINRNTDKI